jgi:hypothetical protein
MARPDSLEEHVLQFIQVDGDYVKVWRGAVPGTIRTAVRNQDFIAESMGELLSELRTRFGSVYLPGAGQ